MTFDSSFLDDSLRLSRPLWIGGRKSSPIMAQAAPRAQMNSSTGSVTIRKRAPMPRTRAWPNDSRIASRRSGPAASPSPVIINRRGLRTLAIAARARPSAEPAWVKALIEEGSPSLGRLPHCLQSYPFTR